MNGSRDFPSATKISIIIPAYNEEANIESMVRRTLQISSEENINYEIETIVVDDGSTDQTHEKGTKTSAKVLRHETNKGKGAAFRTGISAASGDIVVQIDADGQFLPEEILNMIAPIIHGDAEVVFGSRFLTESSVEPGSIKLMNRIANFMVSSMTSAVCGTKITDIMAGFKAFQINALRGIDFKEDSFAYEPEIAILASKKRIKIVDMPVSYRKRKHGVSNIRLLSDSLVISGAILRNTFR